MESLVTLEQANAALTALTQKMNADELEVLALVARKIVNGSAKHGPMALDTDTRNWPKEIQDERIDAALYGYMEQIQTERRKARETKDVAALEQLRQNIRAMAGGELP